MSCNNPISMRTVADQVADILSANYIDRDDPRITNGVFTSPSIRGEFILDPAAKLVFCGYVQECGVIPPFGKAWLDRPVYPDYTLVSYEEAGETKTRWELISDVVEGAIPAITDAMVDSVPVAGGVSRTQQSINADTTNPKDFGAIGTGAQTLLADKFFTLAAAQEIYPFVTSLDDSVDWAATQAAANYAAAEGYTLNLIGRRYYLTRSVNSEASIEGNGAIIYTPGASQFDAITLSDKPDITIAGVTFKRIGVTSGRGYAIKASGKMNNTKFRDIIAEKYEGAVHIDGDSGTLNNAIHAINLSNTATGGTFIMAYYDPTVLGEVKWTTDIAWNSTASQLQTILDAAHGAGKILVTGGPLPKKPLQLEFINSYGKLLIQEPLFRFQTSGSKSYGGAVTVIQEGGTNVAKQITFDGVVARDSGLFGIQVDNARNLNFINCEMTGSWLDGVKLRKNVKGVTFLGGDYSYNGAAWFADGTNQEAGDGIDCYAGGENITLIGTRLNNNNSAGIQIKNDDDTFLTGYGVGKFGMNRKVELIGVEACYNRVNSGISVTINSSTNPANTFLATDINITGGRYEGNAAYGIQVAAGRATVNNTITNHNGLAGLFIASQTNYAEVNNCISMANGTSAKPSYGISIAGKNVTVNGGMYYGVDTSGMAVGTDYNSLTPTHTTNVFIDNTAENVFINMVDEGRNISGRGIAISQTPGSIAKNIIIHQRPTELLNPGSSLIFGSVGSMVYKRDAVQAADQVFIKVLGGPLELGIWRRLVGSSVTQTLGSLVMTGKDEVVSASATSAATTITLPPILNQVGMRYSISKYAGTFDVIVQPLAGETLDGGTVPTTITNAKEGIEVIGTTTGWRTVHSSVTPPPAPVVPEVP